MAITDKETKDIKKEEATRKAAEIAGGGFGGPKEVGNFDDLAKDLEKAKE